MNGGQDFAAAMSSNQTINMSGAAMATLGGCEGADGSYLYKIIINYANETLGNRYRILEALDESLKVASAPVIYGIDGQNNAVRLSNDLLDFSPTLSAAGKFTASTTCTVAAKDGSGLTLTISADRFQ